MKTTRLVSRVLFYITRLLSGLYFLLAFLSVVALTTGWGLIIREDGKYFSVTYPFTDKHLLNGDYNINYIFFYFLIPLSLYGLFFLLLSNVLNVFTQPRLFTGQGVKHLERFYLASFITPVLLIIASILFDEVEAVLATLALLHIMLGVFAYFLAAIFKQGLQLQNEQDLYI